MSVKDFVKDNKKVKFVSFREGEFLYETECGFQFPVSLSDVGKATLLAEDKAMFFMRYIRQHLEFIKSSHDSGEKRDYEVDMSALAERVYNLAKKD